MNFIKSHWKLLLIAVGVVILLGWIGSVTGTNGKLYDMLMDQLTADKNKLVKDQAEWIKTCEGEIRTLAADKVEAEKEKLAALQRVIDAEERATVAEMRVAEKEGRIRDLEKKLRDIVVSGDPDALVKHLQGYGIRIHYR